MTRLLSLLIALALTQQAARVDVSTSAELTTALATAPSGAIITTKLGIYTGTFTVSRNHHLTGKGELVAARNLPALTITGTDVTVSDITIAGNSDDLVKLGPQAARVTLERVTIEGRGSAKRGVQLDGTDVAVMDSTIRNIRRIGQDSQAIAGWNGRGPYRIHGNTLEAASENILFGGSDPVVKGTIPSDITITNNTLTKDLSWTGKGYNVKNLLELKSARRVTIRGNTMEHAWPDGQAGFALVITPVNQDGGHAAATVEDVLFEDNVIRDAHSGIQMYRPEGLTLRKVTFRRNLFETGKGRFMLLLGGMDAVAFEHNTIRQQGTSFIYLYDGHATNFRFVGNLVRTSGIYGICSQGNCMGHALATYFPGGVIERNALVGFPEPKNLPKNLHLAASDPDPKGYGRE